MTLNHFLLGAFTLMCLTGPLLAEGEKFTKIERTSPHHTTIVIHDTTPQAQRARAEQVERGRRRQAEREWRRHQPPVSQTQAVDTQPVEDFNSVASIRERQKYLEYQPAPFFNGGQFTGFTYGFGSYGFPIYGYGFPGHGYDWNSCHYQGHIPHRPPVTNPGHHGHPRYR